MEMPRSRRAGQLARGLSTGYFTKRHTLSDSRCDCDDPAGLVETPPEDPPVKALLLSLCAQRVSTQRVRNSQPPLVIVVMRRQCGIAVVAATLATGKGSTTPPRDAVTAPQRVLLRRKPRGSLPPSVLEEAIPGRRKPGAPPTVGRVGNPLLRGLRNGWNTRQEASCADATPCSQPLRRTNARRVRSRGFVGPIADHDAAEDNGARTPFSRIAGGSIAGARAAAAGDMHSEVLLVRGGGTSWFGRSDYDEFPPDFDYEPTEDDDDDDDGGGGESGAEDSSTAFCWPEDDEDPVGSASAAAPPPQPERDSVSSSLDLKDFLEEDALMKDNDDQQGMSRRRRRSGRPDRKTLPPGGFGQGGGGAEGGAAASPSRDLERFVLSFLVLDLVCARVWFEHQDPREFARRKFGSDRIHHARPRHVICPALPLTTRIVCSTTVVNAPRFYNAVYTTRALSLSGSRTLILCRPNGGRGRQRSRGF